MTYVLPHGGFLDTRSQPVLKAPALPVYRDLDIQRGHAPQISLLNCLRPSYRLSPFATNRLSLHRGDILVNLHEPLESDGSSLQEKLM